MCLQVLGRAAAHVKKGSINPFVAPEEAACNLHMNCLQCHSVDMLHCGYWMHLALKIRPLVQHSSNTFKLSMESFKTNVPISASAEAQKAHFIFHTFLFFKTWHLLHITHNASSLLSDHWSQIMYQIICTFRLGLQKALSYFFHICSRTNQDL